MNKALGLIASTRKGGREGGKKGKDNNKTYEEIPSLIEFSSWLKMESIKPCGTSKESHSWISSSFK
jgi:hypothetical protein